MPLPVISGVSRAALSGVVEGGTRWTNVWHAHFTGVGSPTTTDFTNLANGLVTLYNHANTGGANGWITGFGGTGTTLDDIAIIPLDGSTATMRFSAAISAPGGSPALPGEDAFTLTLRTGFRGRSKRGRVYLPPIEGSQVINGRLNVAVPPIIVTTFNAMVTTLAANNWSPVVASYKLAAAQLITGVNMSGIGVHQRRRRGNR